MMIKLSERFRLILKEPYYFHLHTKYTDGNSSVEDYCKEAQVRGVKHIIFTEHVRRKMSYEFNDFIQDIEVARDNFIGLDIWVGVEAKVLEKGKLDLPEKLSSTQVICIACHSFQGDSDALYDSLIEIFKNSRIDGFIYIWIHPATYFKVKGGESHKKRQFHNLLVEAEKNGVLLEENVAYPMPNGVSFASNSSNMIKGLNAHSVKQLVRI